MADIPFPISTAPGEVPGIGGGRLINCYAERLSDGARKLYKRRRSAGLLTMTSTGHDGVRGMHYYAPTLFVAQDARMTEVTASGLTYVSTDNGALAGSGRVTMARNNKVPVADVLCVTENDVFQIAVGVPPAALGDPDLPQSLTVCFVGGYFIFAIADGRMFASGLNAVTVNALDFARAESRPGGLLGACAYGDMLLAYGPSFMEIWQNVGNATGFPFSRSAVIPLGVAATHAIAGFEDGFSDLVLVGDDNCVYILSGGYQPQKISTSDLERLIQNVADKSELDVTVYISDGHRFACVSGPNFSWEFNLGEQNWNERKSYFLDNWRGKTSQKAFGAKWVVGDRTTDEVWMIEESTHYEGTEPLSMEVWSAPMSAFPNRQIFPRVDFDFRVDAGLISGAEPIETDPVCRISWSDDGGVQFGTPVVRSLGRVGEPKKTVSVNRTGMATRYGRMWKVEVLDPVNAPLLGGSTDGLGVSR